MQLAPAEVTMNVQPVVTREPSCHGDEMQPPKVARQSMNSEANGSREDAAGLLGIQVAQGELWNGANPLRRVLLCWEWFRAEALKMDGKALPESMKQLSELQHSFNSAAKVKAHGARSTGLYLIEHVIFYSLVCFSLPHLLALEWHVNLKRSYIENEGNHPSHSNFQGESIVAFSINLGLIVFFLGSLRVLAFQMNDPFGDDAVDIPVAALGARLSEDANLLVENAKAAAVTYSIELV